MGINNAYINPATIFSLVILWFYIKKFRINRFITLILIPFAIRIIFGKIFADYYLTDDEISAYHEHLRVIGGTSQWAYNHFIALNSKLFSIFGHDLSTIRSMNSLLSTLTVNHLYQKLIVDNKLHTPTRAWIFHYFPTFILLSSTTAKANFVGIGLVLLSAHFLYQTKFKKVLVTSIGIFFSLIYRRYIFAFAIVSSLISTLRISSSEKIKISILFIFLVSPPIIYIFKQNTIINLHKAYQASFNCTPEKQAIFGCAKPGESTMNKVFKKANINDIFSRSIFSIARSIWSPSPIKPVRDYLRGDQKINANWVLDSLVNATSWYLFFPFFVILYIYLIKTKSHILFMANIFIINHIASAVNDVIWMPQFVRYRLPGFIIFTTLSLYALFNRSEIYKVVGQKIRKAIFISWSSLALLYNILYLVLA